MRPNFGQENSESHAAPAAGLEWDSPNPFTLPLVVEGQEIDEYNHVNNAAYVRWLDRCAWAHSTALGISVESCRQLDRGMAVRRSQIEYLAPAVLGDKVIVATWITSADGKLRATRGFQVIRASSGASLLRATIEYICIALSTGRPVRMPAIFVERYRQTDSRG